jgi:hypothetical protein
MRSRKRGMPLVRVVLLMGWILFLGGVAQAVEVITEGRQPVCEDLFLYRELPVFNAFFVSSLSEMSFEGEAASKDLLQEGPLLTTVKGNVSLVRLGPPGDFRSYKQIERLYDLDRLKDARSSGARKKFDKSPVKLIPIMFCGSNDPYNSTLAYVLASDLEQSSLPPTSESGQLPPSTRANPIPNLKVKKN